MLFSKNTSDKFYNKKNVLSIILCNTYYTTIHKFILFLFYAKKKIKMLMITHFIKQNKRNQVTLARMSMNI